MDMRDLVENQIKSEIEDGNYLVVDNKPTIISALGAIPKRHGGIRLIHDCSFPPGQSLNDAASKDPCTYQTVKEAISMLKPGSYMAKIELHAAYRSVCVRSDQWPLTGLKWTFSGSANGVYLVDTKLPFGARKSPAIFNRLTQAVRRMMARRGFNNCVVLLDDFFVTAESFDECLYVYSELLKLLRTLGFRINWCKVVDPTQDLDFLGVRMNTVSG